MGLNDRLVWEETNDGKYSISGAYHLEVRRKRRELGESSRGMENSKFWEKKFGY